MLAIAAHIPSGQIGTGYFQLLPGDPSRAAVRRVHTRDGFRQRSGSRSTSGFTVRANPGPLVRGSPSDHMVASGMLPARRDPDGPFAWWQQMRPRFFAGFHRCLPALAGAGNDLIVEHIIEFRAWRENLARLLDGLDVFLVGVHCDLAEIDRRERERGTAASARAGRTWKPT